MVKILKSIGVDNFLTSDATFKSSIIIRALKVIETMFANGDKNKVTAVNIITQAYNESVRKSGTYLVNGFESPGQKRLQVEGTAFLNSDVECWELQNPPHVDIFV